MYQRYENCVIAFCQGPADNWHGFALYNVVVPNVARLTSKRRVEIAKLAIAAAGREIPDAPDAAFIQWSKTHMGRYDRVEISDNGDGTISYNTESTSGGSIPAAQFIIENLGA